MNSERAGDAAHLPLTVEPFVGFHPTTAGRTTPAPRPAGPPGLALSEEPAIWPDAERLTG